VENKAYKMIKELEREIAKNKLLLEMNIDPSNVKE
jgi:hypothetical protein